NLISKEKKIKAIWSNPNIEVWFSAYLGEITHYSKFIKIYEQKTGRAYNKTDKNIYKNLRNISTDSEAIKLSELRLKETEENNIYNPAQQFPASKMHELLNELKNLINIKLD
ncbi:MAG: RloB domain-containing protein, partial [Armatimonadetes bacterium]|nr:RloB domain-containing protein [Candidatus Hippobium faecium]